MPCLHKSLYDIIGFLAQKDKIMAHHQKLLLGWKTFDLCLNNSLNFKK